MKRLLITFLWFTLTLWGEGPQNYGVDAHNACYKHRNVPYGVNDLFEGLKKVLMQSNLNIATVSRDNGVITAKGNQYNDDTFTEVTVSLTFKAIDENQTDLSMIASYSVMEKKSNTGQIGAAGVSLPIPVPLTGRYAMVGSGNIEESAWYQAFFTSLDKILFEERIRSLD